MLEQATPGLIPNVGWEINNNNGNKRLLEKTKRPRISPFLNHYTDQFQIGGERKIRACIREPNLIKDLYTDASLFIIAELQRDIKEKKN